MGLTGTAAAAGAFECIIFILYEQGEIYVRGKSRKTISKGKKDKPYYPLFHSLQLRGFAL